MTSISVIHKKRGRKPTGHAPVISLRLSDELQKALDAWIAAQPGPKPTRSEAIRLALQDWLRDKGHLK
jgi:Arc/MetJ-type ribon-helix-helix transcriptional regulator